MPTYIYAITGADHPMPLEGLHGVGDPPSELRTVRTGRLAAVVGDAPAGLRAKRRDVMAHQNVLEALMAGGATLPMRFGLVGPGDDEVTAALEREADAYEERLAELDGQVEYNLKAGREEDDLLREIMTESDEIRQLNERVRAQGSHDDRIALGELVAREVTARGQREAEDVAQRLADAATRSSHAEPAPQQFLNLSFLVPRAETEGFVAAVQKEADRRGDAYTFTLTGPLPPYSFV
ncbi:GvpL/GvpF family gas vesicle protein [Streptomyces sp. NPDC059698]|uniref:GvpL/GvpF family gas vesicle protein n=1 Tax=unclassified Streptomyces TaxID=2593676 RepID=UPI00093C77E1|nr:GvpL/GvpF family gas vesicle protein [Streptomyces sp. CB02366]TVP37626.1 gas vesicle protein [Streptomyces griseus subsp. griseus]WSS54061.1 GvpL/GvpF family gas vesicle protein [Streptomyces sp. NBC_01178]